MSEVGGQIDAVERIADDIRDLLSALNALQGGLYHRQKSRRWPHKKEEIRRLRKDLYDLKVELETNWMFEE